MFSGNKLILFKSVGHLLRNGKKWQVSACEMKYVGQEKIELGSETCLLEGALVLFLVMQD